MLFSTRRCGELLVCLTFVCQSFGAFAADYYWVGGSGDWSEINHWATTSGGTVNHAQAPTANDDVFFDANSFPTPGQTVTINGDVAFCRDLDWRGVTNFPAFTGGANVTLSVFGDFRLADAMNYTMAGTLNFTGGGLREIDVDGRAAANFVIFEGVGEWSLASDLRVDSILLHREGTLRTADQNVSVGYWRSVTQAERRLELGASQITIRNAKTGLSEDVDGTRLLLPFDLVADRLVVVPGSSTINMLGEDAEVFFRGGGQVRLNILALSSATGESLIRASNGLQLERLELAHAVTLRGDQVIGTLQLFPGQQYRFWSRNTFTIGELVANGSCGGTIGLSSTEDRPANFRSNRPVVADFVSLRGINATGIGGGSFTATNAVDQGNNTGWTITQRAGQNLYWVGGSGEWNDPLHWSDVSGGTGGGCTPTLADSIFFDQNSFTAPDQSVTVNVGNASCGNMDWTGVRFTPRLTGPDINQLRIGQSLTFIPQMIHDFAGDYEFTAVTPGHTVTSAGQRFARDVTFSGTGGWTLNGDLYVDDALRLTAGALSLNDLTLDVRRLLSPTTSDRSLRLGNSEILLRSRGGSLTNTNLELNTNNLTFNADNSRIEFASGNEARLELAGDAEITFNEVIFRTSLGLLEQTITGDGTRATFANLSCESSMEISGNNRMERLALTAGLNYELAAGSEQSVGSLDVGSDCAAGPTAIVSSAPDARAFLALPPVQAFNRLLLRNIELRSLLPALLLNSVDAGGNDNWLFQAAARRNLYWVGGTGNWYDPGHWSLTSGGAGGECVPTTLDNVFFDGNSDDGGDFIVYGRDNRSATCNDLTWTADQTAPTRFEVGRLRLGGSFRNEGSLDYRAGTIDFIGSGNAVIQSGGTRLANLDFLHTGSYTIEDELNAAYLRHYSGDLTFTGTAAELRILEVPQASGTRILELGGLHLRLTESEGENRPALELRQTTGFTLISGTSRIELTGADAYARIRGDRALNQLVFSAVTGTGRLDAPVTGTNRLTAQQITFNGNGSMEGNTRTDTLLFAPGKAYRLGAGDTQEVQEYWRVIGNNCAAISLQSSFPGAQALVNAPSTADILADFIQMRNITASGGNDFRAGARSTDIGGSNVGWTFETSPELADVGFLGEDQVICAGESVTVSAFNFTLNETYEWSDGSVDTRLTTATAGTYTARVTFENNCFIEDEVVLTAVPEFAVTLPADTTLCAGDSLVLDATVNLPMATYAWNDLSGSAQLTVGRAGSYAVVVDVAGCLEADTFRLAITEYPEVVIDGPELVCAGNDFTLAGAVAGATGVRWQDGSDGSTFTGSRPGNYWLEATNGNCPARDSFTVTYVDPAPVDLGPDTTLCDAQSFTLNATTPGYTYRWQDASDAPTFTAEETGTFFVVIDTAGCTQRDTVRLTFPVFPPNDIVDGYEFCQGDTLRLSTTVNADAIRWSDGRQGTDFATQTGGTFSVAYTFGPCLVEQSFTVDVLPLPAVNLGDDATACTGDTLSLAAGQTGTWQDGRVVATYSATETGRYTVRVSDGLCTANDTVNLTFLAPPALALGGDQSACSGDSLALRVDATELEAIVWSDGNAQNVPARFFTASGNYGVRITDVNGCSSADSVTLSFADLPALSLSTTDTTTCSDRALFVSVDAGPGELRWPDGSSPTRYRVRESGPLIVTLTNGGCTARDTAMVTLEDCVDFQTYFPTAFSPNGDGINDDFGPQYSDRVEVRGFRLEVYDRWGALRFSTDRPDDRWDGTHNGRSLPTGVYLYIFSVDYQDDRGAGSLQLAGDIMLVR